MKRKPGKYERLFHERQARDLANPRGMTFSDERGDRVVTFLEKFCKHHKGEWAGKQLILEPWQKDVMRTAFGWLKADGTRRFRTLYIEIPRKNGKSEVAAGLGLYLMLADGESGAEVYSAATKKDQAKIVWDTAAAMVKKSPQLKRHIKSSYAKLVVERNASFFAALSSDSNTLDGLNPHGVVVDELHAHKDRGVWDILDTAMGSRRQPVIIAITTAGTYDPTRIGWQLHDYATNVLDGVFEDDAFFAFIAAADESDDYFSEETQRKANPNFGISVKPDYMAKQATMAQRQPSFLNEYLRLHLNVWTQQVTRWLPMDKWVLCEDASPAPADLRRFVQGRETALEGLPCFGGLDLSTKLDLSALVLAFPSDGDVINVLCRFWLPEARALDEERKARRHYATWARDGWLTLTPGDVVDYEFIRKEVNDLAKHYHLRELAYDPWGATDLATRLQGDGIVMVECRQGFKTLSEPSKDLEARLMQAKVRHAHNPILRWCFANAVIDRDAAGNIKPDKERASGRIDGVVALVMAMSRGIVYKDDQDHAYKNITKDAETGKVVGGFKSL